MSNKNRNKGHRLERLLAKVFRWLGFAYCKTSRQASRLLDDCGIDLAFVPFLVQAKAGYNRNRPKYEIEYQNIKKNIKENYPKDDKIHDMPIVLIHKLDGRGPEHFQWIFMHDDIIHILKEYYELKNERELSKRQEVKSKLSKEIPKPKSKESI